MGYRNEARVVGYLGFRTRIFLNRCTNCAQMGRDVEPLPFPFSHSRLNCKPVASQARLLFQRNASRK